MMRRRPVPLVAYSDTELVRKARAVTVAWEHLEQELWDRALSEMPEDIAFRVASDPFAESFYHEAMWNWHIAGDTRAEMYENFVGYMEDYFGIEWEEVFDWDDWREAYDAAAG